MNWKQIGLLLVILMPFSLWGQGQGILKGMLNGPKGPVPFGTVMIEGTGLATAANDAGQFVLENVPEGPQVIVVQAVGHRTFRSQVVVAPGETTTWNPQLEGDVFGLDQLVVTATRSEQNRSEAPVLVQVLDSRLFASTQSNSLSEGLVFQPGVRMETNCQNCGFTQVRLNGMEGAYSQILIDGRAVFSALNGVYGLDQIPASMIDRVEVVRGGGSALYGANAIAGTINIITKDPLYNSVEIATNSALIDGTTPDHTLNLNGSWVSADGKIGASVFGMLRDRDWYDANGDGFSEITVMENQSIGGKAFYRPGKQTRIGLEIHRMEEYRRGGNLFDRLPHETDITEELDHLTHGGEISLDQWSADLKTKWSLYASGQTTQRDSYYGGGGNTTDPTEQALARLFYGETEDVSLVSGLQFNREMSGIGAKTATLTVGVEGQLNDVLDEMPGYDRAIDQRVRTLGQYAQFEFRPLPALKVLAGARLDLIQVDGAYNFGGEAFTNDQSFAAFNPRFNVLYDLTTNSRLRLSYARGFRAPQAFDEDLHIETLGGSARFIRLAENLESERSDSYTLSYEQGRKWGKTDVKLVVDGFYTFLSNPFINEFTGVTLEPSGATVEEKRNAGSGARVYGANLEVQLAPSKRFSVQFGGTVQRALYEEAQVLVEVEAGPISENEVVVASSKILRTPNVYGFFASTWEATKQLDVSLSGVYTGSMSILNNRTLDLRDTPAFMEVNLRGEYTIAGFKKMDLKVNGGVQNVLNSYQSDFEVGPDRDSNYVYGPARPRTYFVGLKLALK